ncbi:MAG TPA: putative peptidoglycan glycosyltransferase FtsW [Phycisphaerae bacterium]|nr:putative peptidoglycan glycosyltransferase FtsW [Phycisphaerae bacterium]HOJ55646.1 putative peptidoglycan glycosyltransferase FtsW [Phycisphaerae bacterium]HOL27657.1 putative peptidoglycan glycosyltransferase FtsW [Phycisphaerae bacterium]HPP21959.1 putative peptidoglycan glycosyltransferase FtsW [Phycisphaerae bacterium]HPU33568.1 putative peptidoglycan glycosyltransferase FtsW [Phycisphaerae bacterium]
MSQATGPMEMWQAGEPRSGAGEASAGSFASTAILSIATGLLGIGAVMTYSATAGSERPVTLDDWWKSQAIRQLIYVVGGLVTMLIMSRIPYRLWMRGKGLPALLLLVAALIATLLVLVPGVGHEAKGATRWVKLGPVNFQPSEMMKLALPVFLATWMAYKVDVRKFWRGFLPAAGIIGISVGAVGLEDFGTAALLAAVGGAMLLAGGALWRHVFLLVLPAVPAFLYLLHSRAHRMKRLTTFLNIWEDPQGDGYQAIQSLCTIASGGWWGRGLGKGFVKGYLPEARSDFIFAVICEELGAVGAFAVIGLLIILLWQGAIIIRRCEDPMGRLLAFAMVLVLGMQATMNIAVVTVSVPTKGISLPLVSAGGTGVIFLGMLVGVLANIARTAPGQVEWESDKVGT